MGWHCPKSLSFIETECRFSITETWSEVRWGPRLDLKRTCTLRPMQNHFQQMYVWPQCQCNGIALSTIKLSATYCTNNKPPFYHPFATGLFKKYTTITKFVEKKQYVTTFPGSQHHQNKKRWKFPSFHMGSSHINPTWVSNPTNLQSRQVHHNTCDLPWWQVIQSGKMFFCHKTALLLLYDSFKVLLFGEFKKTRSKAVEFEEKLPKV